MKLLNKVKKGLIGIGLFLLAFPKKIFATSVKNIIAGSEQFIQDLYGPPVSTLYGVQNPDSVPSLMNSIWNVFKIFIIPLVLLIGLIIYFKKSKSSIKRKILITILIIATVAIIYIVGNIIVTNINSF